MVVFRTWGMQGEKEFSVDLGATPAYCTGLLPSDLPISQVPHSFLRHLPVEKKVLMWQYRRPFISSYILQMMLPTVVHCSLVRLEVQTSIRSE